MKFDKSKVYSNKNAKKVKIGSKGVFANSEKELRYEVENDSISNFSTLVAVGSITSRFFDEANRLWDYFYLVVKKE